MTDDTTSYSMGTTEGALYLLLCHLVDRNNGSITVSLDDLRQTFGRFEVSVTEDTITITTLRGPSDVEH